MRALAEKRVAERPVAGFNLVAAAEGEALCLHYDGALREAPLGPGAHVLSTDRDLDDPAMPEKRVFDRLAGALPAEPSPETLAPFLSSHEDPRPVCKHGEAFGTVSSAIYAAGAGGVRLWHADGPPCTTPFREFSGLLV